MPDSRMKAVVPLLRESYLELLRALTAAELRAEMTGLQHTIWASPLRRPDQSQTLPQWVMSPSDMAFQARHVVPGRDRPREAAMCPSCRLVSWKRELLSCRGVCWDCKEAGFYLVDGMLKATCVRCGYGADAAEIDTYGICWECNREREDVPRCSVCTVMLSAGDPGEDDFLCPDHYAELNYYAGG